MQENMHETDKLDLNDMDLFVRICQYLDDPSGKIPTFQDLYQRLDTPASTLSISLKRLEEFLGGQLISRSRKSGIESITEFGKQVRARGMEIVKLFDQLKGGASERMIIATTHAIRHYVLPVAITAYLLTVR